MKGKKQKYVEQWKSVNKCKENKLFPLNLLKKNFVEIKFLQLMLKGNLAYSMYEEKDLEGNPYELMSLLWVVCMHRQILYALWEKIREGNN